MRPITSIDNPVDNAIHPSSRPAVPNEANSPVVLFNGRNLEGWEVVTSQGVTASATHPGWTVSNDVLRCETTDEGWLRTAQEYGDFELELDFALPATSNGGILIRTKDPAAPPSDGLEVDLYADSAGGISSVTTPPKSHLLPAGEWNHLKVRAIGLEYRAELNGHVTADVDLANHPQASKLHNSGRIGLYNYKGLAKGMSFRNIQLRRLSAIDSSQEAAIPAEKKPIVQTELVQHGLKAEIFEGPNFEKKVGEQIEPNIECYWKLGAPSKDAPVDNFSVRFTGWLLAPKAGRYKLLLWGWDGARLKLNNQTLIDNWKIKPEIAEVSVELTEDPQPIEVEVFNAEKDSYISLLWQPTGTTAPCPIPATAFFPDLTNARSKAPRSNIKTFGLVADYFDKTFSRRLATDRVYRSEALWGKGAPRWGLTTDTAVRYTGVLVPPVSGQYKLIALANGQIRVWIDDKPTHETMGYLSPQTVFIELEANKPHQIRIETLTTNDGAHYLHWIPPGTSKEVSIPPECLFPNKAALTNEKNQEKTPKNAEEEQFVPAQGELQEIRHGLKTEIFEGQNFEKKVGEQIEPNVECFWELGAPSKDAPVDNFSVRFTGWLRAPKTGRYKLFLSSKDGSRLKINHQTLIDNWRLKPEVAEVSLELTQAPQPIEVEVYNADLYSWVSLLWQPAGTATACHIPASALFPDLENAHSKAPRTSIDKTGLVAEYFDKTLSRRLATDHVYRIEEIWGPHSPRWGLPRDSGTKYTGILVPPVSGQYKLIASAREHIRVWIDEKPTLEARGTQPAQSAVVNLEANKPYEIRVEILTSNHGAHYVHWIPPGTTKEVSIPPECLFPNKAAIRQASATPAAKPPATEKPAPQTISAAERETIERGLAKLKADDEAAGKKLLKAFDEQIEKVRSAPKLSADERVVRIKSLEDEKALFEKHGHIPFSLAMRTETLKYLREFTEARTDAAKVYDKLIETLTKHKKDELASLLRTERDIAIGPKVVAIWRTVEVNGGKKADWTIWSNGSVGRSDRQFLWMMDERRFAIQWFSPPNTRWVDTFVLEEGGMKASVVNEKGVKNLTGERVAP